MIPYKRAKRMERCTCLPSILVGSEIQIIFIGEDRMNMILHGYHSLSVLNVVYHIFFSVSTHIVFFLELLIFALIKGKI